MSMQSSSTMQRKDFGDTVKSVSQQSQIDSSSKMEHQEIGQDKLKTQLESCITDLEKDRDFVDFNKENKPINLSSPPRTFSPVPAASPRKQETFSSTPLPKADMFSPPPLEPMEPPQSKVAPAEPHLVSVPAPASVIQNGVSNGFSDIGSIGSKNMEVQQQFHSSSSFQQSSSVQQVLNGSFEETGSVQGSSSSSSLLQKIMTPAPTEYDSGSLKRRDPRKMFTDSSFYSAKHHPTVADQVDMAHKISSAMFNESNKATKGQQMFLSRVQNAGDEEIDLPDNHGKPPSLKHVMNPEGRTVEWGDVSQEEQANMEMMAERSAINITKPDPIAESLNAEAGKGGELFAKRRKKAENWVVDESTVGRATPSAFADKFVQQQQQVSQEQQQINIANQQQQQYQQQQQKQVQFKHQQEQQQQQQQRMTQSHVTSHQAEIKMQDQIDFPENFQHTSLKARSNTPILDLSCHNVQGINVWANTAPRGWGGNTPGPAGLPKGPAKQQAPPFFNLQPATPSIEQSPS